MRELPLQPAQLAIVDDAASAAAIASSLAAGGFLVVAPRSNAADNNGRLVRALQDEGLQYWQHIVVVDAQRIDTSTIAIRPRKAVELERVHRDLLVFRQPAGAAAVAAPGSVWAEVVAA